ncbi:MAG: hypothetical protein ACI88A_003347, partial [Paraglaciecola sp.]
ELDQFKNDKSQYILKVIGTAWRRQTNETT